MLFAEVYRAALSVVNGPSPLSETLEWRQKYYSPFYGFSGPSFCDQLSLSAAVRLRVALLLYYPLTFFYGMLCAIACRKNWGLCERCCCSHALFLGWIVSRRAEVPEEWPLYK